MSLVLDVDGLSLHMTPLPTEDAHLRGFEAGVFLFAEIWVVPTPDASETDGGTTGSRHAVARRQPFAPATTLRRSHGRLRPWGPTGLGKPSWLTTLASDLRSQAFKVC